jgi:predicted amidohydrolase
VGDVKPVELRSILAWVMVIDGLFTGLGVDLRGDGSAERVMRARWQLAENGSLSTASHPWGLVLPKAATSEYGYGISRVCSALTHVDANVDYEASYKFIEEPGGAAAIGRLRVGIVAAVQSSAELDWVFVDSPPRNTYETKLATAAEQQVIRRVLASLKALSDRAHIVLLPELISSETLVTAVATWLEQTRNRGRRLPIAVLTGSHMDHADPQRPRNIASVLAGDGTLVGRQYKLNPYKLTSVHRAGLTIPGATAGTDYVENISGSPRVTSIFDITGLGRCVVTICEDAARWEPWRRLLTRAGPNLCLAPIMNGQGPEAWAWAIRESIGLANESGTVVLVANSGAMLKPLGRSSADYAAAAFPRVPARSGGWTVLDEGDEDGDGHTDWWLYEEPPFTSPTGT